MVIETRILSATIAQNGITLLLSYFQLLDSPYLVSKIYASAAGLFWVIPLHLLEGEESLLILLKIVCNNAILIITTDIKAN
ncbi:hypothetical protein QMP26_41850 (plasmid) [Enterocloster clostridioformis]